jgi:hypothetical protein
LKKNDKFAAVLRFAINRELTRTRLDERLHEHDSDPQDQLFCSRLRHGDPFQRQPWTIDSNEVDGIMLGIAWFAK